MLSPATTYADLVSRFCWKIPERYNMGVDACDRWADATPDAPALIHQLRDGRITTLSFADLRSASNRVANLLQAHGIGQGDRVGILLPQAPETAYSHIAAYKMGAIAVPLFTLFGVEALEYRLRDSGARAVITDATGGARLAQIRANLPDLRIVFSIEGESAGVLDLHSEMTHHSDQFTPLDTHADDPAVIIYTSGTTGPPKGALHAQRVLLGHLPGVEMSHDLFPQPGDRIWTPADWAWIGGLFDVLMPALHHGITVVSRRFEKFDPEAAFQLMEDFGVRNTFLPPTALKMMRTVRDPERRWNYHLRTVASGGESLGSELLDWGRRTFGLTINEFYGQTECNMIVSSCAAVMEARAGKMGRAVPGHTLAIVDEAGTPQPNGSLGQIAVQQPDPVMFLGYWQNPSATERKFANGWLLTGDTGVMDDDGYIHFQGRNDDIINSSGYRIGPGEVENCLLGHPAVRMAGVIGVPDELRGEIVKAFIVLEDGYTPSDELAHNIQAYVRERLAAHEYPRLITFISELPLTTTGKIMRRLLKKGEFEGKPLIYSP